MMNHLDWCTHMGFKGDRDILTRKLFDVNIRLMKANEHYAQLIRDCCSYIQSSANLEKEGYSNPLGWSGANAGIPFNIIALKWKEAMINPKILMGWGERNGKSNCGSLTLKEKVKVKRFEEIQVSWFALDCSEKVEIFKGRDAGTIQHEIDHNLGILIGSESE